MSRVQVVFLGPSLSHAEARAIHPHAILLPPASMGDVLGAVRRYRPHAVGLVDGTFLSTMSVFHKELLYAIDQGAWMLGSSSMGALRAAETDRYGVLGVGEIYRALAAGDIEDDDEVALTHADAEGEYRALSDAMVTIRAGIAGALDANIIESDEARELIRRSKDRWFPDRRLTTVVADAMDMQLPAAKVEELREFLRYRAVDPKRTDAVELLRTMQQLPDQPPDRRPETVMSPVFHALLARDVVLDVPEGSTTFDRMRRYAAVNEPDYESVMSAARQRLVLIGLGVWLMGDPSDSEFARGRERICERFGIGEAELDERALELDLDDATLKNLIYGEAIIDRWERSSMARLQHGLVTSAFSHELRLRGRYEDVRAAAALQRSAATHVHLPEGIRAGSILRSHAALTGWQIPEDLEHFLEESELGSVSELMESLELSVRAQQALFGVGLVENGEAIQVVEDGEPMMTRGA
jgi:hypothetical protein